MSRQTRLSTRAIRKKLNILIISRDFREGGGVATHVHYLAAALSRLRSRKLGKIHILTTGEITAKGGVPPRLIIHRLVGEKSHFSVKGEIPFGDVVRYCQERWKE